MSDSSARLCIKLVVVYLKSEWMAGKFTVSNCIVIREIAIGHVRQSTASHDPIKEVLKCDSFRIHQ